MNLVKTTFLSGISTAIRMACGLVINKIVAVIAGPPGLAMMGQFQNFISITAGVGTGSIGAGVVKYTAEHRGNQAVVRGYFRAAGMITLACVAMTMLVALLCTGAITKLVFGSEDWRWLTLLTVLTLPLFGANALGLAILNGMNEIREYIVISTLQSLFGMALLIPLAFWLGLQGALAALVFSQTVVFVFLAWRLRRHHLARLENFFGRFPRKLVKSYGKFSIMAVTSAIAGATAQIYIRETITSGLSSTDAGIWQGMVRISTAYLTVITTALQVYYLPKLSAARRADEIRAEVLTGIRFIVPLMILGCALIWLFRDRIILLLFTRSFLPMRDLFFWQLAGDVIKIISWLFAFLLWAKGMMRTFVISEIIGWLVYAVLAKASLVLHLGLLGPILANLMNYCLYAIFAALLFRHILRAARKTEWIPV